MITVIDAKEWVFDHIRDNNPNISGHIYIDKRPSFDKEDIVVNSIIGDSEFWQNIVLNVNCYVPDLRINTGGKVMNVPDRAQLKAIGSEMHSILDDFWVDQKYRAYVENMQQFEATEEESHYINFRIQMYAVNTK